MDYIEPVLLDDALSALSGGAPRIVAGGTDWYPAQGERPIQGDMLDITGIDGLRGISITQTGEWRIGAATTWTDLLQADLPPAFNGLKAAAREVGSVQIQNTATIAGNLCNASPAADGVPPLLVLGARIEIASLAGNRVLPLEEFILGVRKTALEPGEMVTALVIAPQNAGKTSSFVKLGARKYLVISIAMVCVAIELEDGLVIDARIAVGACSPVAQRLFELEQDMMGLSVADAIRVPAAEHLAVLAPIDDVRGSGAYRREVVPALVAQAIVEAAHG